MQYWIAPFTKYRLLLAFQKQKKITVLIMAWYNAGKDKLKFEGDIYMSEFTINEMKEMQKILQEKYKDKWEGISAEVGQNKLLWMVGEIGEVIDIVKKHSGLKASQDEDLRKDLIEELADVLMYYNDVLLCYDISSEELKTAYVHKFEKNMKRW